MSDEIANTPVDPTQFPEAAHKHARRALREHQRAEKDALNAVQHAVKSGQSLLKAYDLCEYGQWEGFFEMHFQQADKVKRLSPRTARKYMQLARNWSQLSAQHPEGFSSQRQALKALAAIVEADKSDPDGASSAARGQSAGGKRKRSGPVWRASGPFVKEALALVRSINESLTKLIGQGYPVGNEAENVNAALARLQQMIDTDLDECEAQQARGEMDLGDGKTLARRWRPRWKARCTMTTKFPNRLARMADERRNTLKLLAHSANLSHRWAAASAGAAIAHMVAAGHALIQARDLCEEGGWLRKSFDGSVRTAQRYMRVARHLPQSGIDATRVSHRSQAAVLRAIRGVVFTGPATAGERCASAC
jgi:hypothetical protein